MWRFSCAADRAAFLRCPVSLPHSVNRDGAFSSGGHEHGVEVGVPDEGEFEDAWLELFVAYRSLSENSVEEFLRFLEASGPFVLRRGGEVAGWREHELGLAGGGFAVFSLRGGAYGVLFIDSFFLDASEFDDAFWVPGCVDEVEVGAVAARFEDARRCYVSFR